MNIVKCLNSSLIILLVVIGCSPSGEDIRDIVRDQTEETVLQVLEAIPTATPIVFPTPLPTSTPMAFPTPLPTATPMAFPTPLPTATPMAFPTPLPTATPINIPPTATLQPTATPTKIPTILDFNKVYLQTFKSVFWIETAASRGTGWLLEPGLIVTNQHVVGIYPTVTVRQNTDAPFVATVLATDTLRDIALIKYPSDTVVMEPDVVPLTLGTISGSDTATPLMALGYSGNLGVKGTGAVGPAPANVGILSSIILIGNYLQLVMDAPVDPGDSGGPVINSSGEVVGMVRAGLGTSTGRHIGTNYSVHVNAIRDAIPDLKRGISQ